MEKPTVESVLPILGLSKRKMMLAINSMNNAI